MQVRVDAVAALRLIVAAYDKEHLHEMKGHLPTLLDQLFKLMQEVSTCNMQGSIGSRLLSSLHVLM